MRKILGGFPGCDRSVGVITCPFGVLIWTWVYNARTRSAVRWLSSLICWQFCLVWWLNSPLFINTIERDVFRSQQENGIVVGNTSPLEGSFLLFKAGLKKGQTAIIIGNILRRLESLQNGLQLVIVYWRTTFGWRWRVPIVRMAGRRMWPWFTFAMWRHRIWRRNFVVEVNHRR